MVATDCFFILYQLKAQVLTASLGSDDTNFTEEDARVGSYESIGYDKKLEEVQERAH